MRLLYYSPSSRGGLASYAHEQANALAELGVEVTLLCTPEFFPDRGDARYAKAAELTEFASPALSRHRALRALRYARVQRQNVAVLRRRVVEDGFRHVLFGAYYEYLAPLWSPPLRALARRGVVFGTVVHDPVRVAVAGPAWLHRWSVAAAYSFTREVFVHEESHLAAVPRRQGVRATVIPQGIYGAAPPARGREAVRAELGVPPGATLLLAFGYLRDSKNLDLVIRALARFPHVYLLVSGQVMSSRDRPMSHYQALAAEVGVAERCRWRPGFVPDAEVSELFGAADLVLLTYGGGFVSASAVANTAAAYRKPVLASSGGGWLRATVEAHALGVWVPPDSEEAIADGLRRCLAHPPAPDWEGFAAEHSWTRNAEIVIERMWGDNGTMAIAPPVASRSEPGETVVPGTHVGEGRDGF